MEADEKLGKVHSKLEKAHSSLLEQEGGSQEGAIDYVL
jgi:arginine/ornithine N-succinyltransferase beta subunit